MTLGHRRSAPHPEHATVKYLRPTLPNLTGDGQTSMDGSSFALDPSADVTRRLVQRLCHLGPDAIERVLQGVWHVAHDTA